MRDDLPTSGNALSRTYPAAEDPEVVEDHVERQTDSQDTFSVLTEIEASSRSATSS